MNIESIEGHKDIGSYPDRIRVYRFGAYASLAIEVTDGEVTASGMGFADAERRLRDISPKMHARYLSILSANGYEPALTDAATDVPKGFVRVRIGVATWATGEYAAKGGDLLGDADIRRNFAVYEDHQISFITADVPLPRVVEVEGTVE